jgi:uncharacterized protein YecE (DUF72 family)
MGTKWYLGTMGFSYKDWRGPFYPPEMPPVRYLAYYSRFFNAVEIDSTFYGAPRPETILRWKSLTPDTFRFCLKTPREVTHELQLKGARAADTMFTFLERVRLLDHKLGVVLLQFSPSFSAVGMDSLAAFLEQLPRDVRFSVEFRHKSWYSPPTASLLTDLGVSWATTEYPRLPAHLQLTARHLYIRWIGQHGQYDNHDREQADRTENLQSWKKRLYDALPPDQTVYGFFNNDYAGFAPGTCNKFKAMLGLRTQTLHRPRQGRLF